MSIEETAYALDVSEAVGEARPSRARAALRRDLFERAGLAETNAFRFLGPSCDRVLAALFTRIF